MISIATQTKKKRSTKPEKARYTCLICEKNKIEDGFFTNNWSPLWVASGKKILICKDCIQARFDEYKKTYSSEKPALLAICYMVDIPYYADLYQTVLENGPTFSIGSYMRYLQLGQYRGKTFFDTLMGDELFKTELEVREEREVRWSKIDKRNMNSAMAVVGYDPFDSAGFTDEDRRYCFNILAGYCDSDGIQEDGHKIQSVIQITQTQLQCRKIDELLNEELLKVNPDDARIKQLSATKKTLLGSIASIARDNNISSAHSASSKQGASTLTGKMREMIQAGFDDIEVNLFDIKTSDAMKQIADLSNRSIMEQLAFDSNDYTEMLKEQREMILQYEDDTSRLQEENRILKNQLLELQGKKG